MAAVGVEFLLREHISTVLRSSIPGLVDSVGAKDRQGQEKDNSPRIGTKPSRRSCLLIY